MPDPDNVKTELLGMDMSALENYLVSIGQAGFRGRQIHKWIYEKNTASFYEMSDLPRELRQRLDGSAVVSIPRVLKQRVSRDGTRKFLMEFEDKKRVETVLIPQSYEKDSRFTLCLSTQVGCPVNCAFCATGRSGYQRSLKDYEIVGQVLSSRRELSKKIKNGPDNLVNHIVYMGMGEPLLNYEAVISSIHRINDHRGINIGQRNITISTAGEVKGIERLAREKLQVTLAISLHATSDELRDQLVPLNRKYPLKSLLQAANYFIMETGRRVTFEYVLLDGVNNRHEDAQKLAYLLKPLLANINLIPYNEVEGLPYRKPSRDSAIQFHQWLLNEGLNATLREEHGTDIEAACGQLRAEFKNGNLTKY